MLEQQNSHHRSFSFVRDQLAEIVDPNASDFSSAKPLTASEVLTAAGIDRPTNGQAKECAALLREWFGESRRINGRDKWRVPLRPGITAGITEPEPYRPTKSKFD